MSSNLTKEEFLCLEEYKIVNDLLMRESSQFWTRFNVMLAVQVFLFSACSFFLKEMGALFNDGDPAFIDPWVFLVAIGLCILIGIVTTTIWYIVTEKSCGLITFLACRLLVMEKGIPIINKQRDMLEVFYDKVDENSSEFAKQFANKLRKSQKKTVTGYIPYLVIFLLFLWFAMIPLLLYVAFENWLVLGLVASLVFVIISILLINAILERRRIKLIYQAEEEKVKAK